MRRLLLVLSLVVLAACESGADLADAPVPLGDFKLHHNIVVATKTVKGPLSREASEEQLVEAVTFAVDERFGRYDGDGLYHFGISIESYILAQPGIPLVLAPKSGMVLLVTVWDNASGTKLNDKPHQVVVLETFGTGAIVGSGYTLTAEEQLRQLSQNAAKAIERYLVTQKEEQGWFTGNAAKDTSTESGDTASTEG